MATDITCPCFSKVFTIVQAFKLKCVFLCGTVSLDALLSYTEREFTPQCDFYMRVCLFVLTVIVFSAFKMVFYLLFLFTYHEKACAMKAESVVVSLSFDLYL